MAEAKGLKLGKAENDPLDMSSSSASTACPPDTPQQLITLSCCRLPVTSAAVGLPQTFSRCNNSSLCPAAAYPSPRRLLACPRRCLAATTHHFVLLRLTRHPGGCWLAPDVLSQQQLITLSCCRLPVTPAAAGLPQTLSRRGCVSELIGKFLFRGVYRRHFGLYRK